MLTHIIAQKQPETTSLSGWVESVYISAYTDPTMLRALYRHAPVLFKQPRDVIFEELAQYATFDAHHCCKRVARAATDMLTELDKIRGYPAFIEAVKAGQLAGFITDQLLYVVTPSVKPDTPKYQMTTFARGKGPISDALRDIPEAFVTAQFGLPRCARFIGQSALLAVEKHYMKTC